MKTLIVTADDFGLSLPVNDAIEAGVTRGILSAASLMVTAPYAADAVARARRLPQLGVGLHLVLVNGKPALPPDQIPDLVGPDGRFTMSVIGKGIAIFCRPTVRRQMEAEMRAQFDAFRATGLTLDHVNGHHHFHMHPSILELILRVAKDHGVTAVRVPHEPFGPSWRSQRDRLGHRLFSWAFQYRRTTAMARRLRAQGVACNDAIFGFYDSGEMTEARVLAFLRALPDGVSEIYGHPALARWGGPDNIPTQYKCEDEAAALTSPAVVALAKELGLTPARFADLPRA